MYKRMFSVMLSIVLFCFCWQVQASEVVNNTKAISGDNTIQPYYNYTSRIEVSLADSSGDAECKTIVRGYTSVTKIEITMTLQQKNFFLWKDVETWTKTVNSSYSSLTKNTSVDSNKYRVKSVCKVYSGSNSETITEYSSEVSF